jgi:hypothetical protein
VCRFAEEFAHYSGVAVVHGRDGGGWRCVRRGAIGGESVREFECVLTAISKVRALSLAECDRNREWR